ncbi:rfaE bifunctional protein [Thalassoporum mexicanum PCC 7367]|uniref:D-glycero-beta-D-manno-heptose 1-phosphate adenylyltransferase n=1 Tax=Thalassoporum mexicanum TaxID=3457544 RepID=UPI00029FC6BD|nr:D-glycero-beta-D-manno-heptose 1-phosphate adenylyltransferase [Pseudanabaena sp. PCC 7367]AFY68941.1 rfaE bifunctional protein [Pseudanabaena sp. PCC 7367]
MSPESNQVFKLETLTTAIARTPQTWRSIVFTNGCFDLIHAGHVRYLAAAKALGKTLIVGLNSDASVCQLKGESRPIVPQAYRAEVLAALKPVDAVVIFNELTAIETIKALQPDIYVKGGDYEIATLPEAPTVQSYGGKIELIQVELPTSTSAIVNRIKSGRSLAECFDKV